MISGKIVDWHHIWKIIGNTHHRINPKNKITATQRKKKCPNSLCDKYLPDIIANSESRVSEPGQILNVNQKHCAVTQLFNYLIEILVIVGYCWESMTRHSLLECNDAKILLHRTIRNWVDILICSILRSRRWHALNYGTPEQILRRLVAQKVFRNRHLLSAQRLFMTTPG